MRNKDKKVFLPTEHCSGFDLSAILAIERMHNTLHRMAFALSELAECRSVYFVPLPDVSFTSNVRRWRAGFAYGGILGWTSSRLVYFPDIRPNYCGVAFAKLSGRLSDKNIIDAAVISRRNSSKNWDYDRSNHFIGIYEHCDVRKN